MEMNNLFSIEHITKTFGTDKGDICAVDNASFSGAGSTKKMREALEVAL
jgi:hypothetical protein